jgi:hypothetical protein
MFSLPFVRNIILRGSNVLALAVLGLSAYALQVIGSQAALFITYPSLGVATAVLHLASVLPMVIIALLRDGAFTSKLAVEVALLSFLWIMWLATGAQTAAVLGGVFCVDAFCGATQAIAAFSFLLCAMLLGYVIALVCFAVRAGQAGHNIWMTDVKQVRWLEGTANFEKPNLSSPHPNVATYPPGGHPGNMASPVTPQPQYYPPGANPGVMGSPVTPQPQYYPQQGGGYTA